MLTWQHTQSRVSAVAQHKSVPSFICLQTCLCVHSDLFPAVSDPSSPPSISHLSSSLPLCVCKGALFFFSFFFYHPPAVAPPPPLRVFPGASAVAKWTSVNKLRASRYLFNPYAGELYSCMQLLMSGREEKKKESFFFLLSVLLHLSEKLFSIEKHVLVCVIRHYYDL